MKRTKKQFTGSILIIAFFALILMQNTACAFSYSFSADRSSGEVHQQRVLSVTLRNNTIQRRITFFARHESESAWRVIHSHLANNRALWTPARPGRYRLRVNISRPGPGSYSRQISFTACGPGGGWGGGSGSDRLRINFTIDRSRGAVHLPRTLRVLLHNNYCARTFTFHYRRDGDWFWTRFVHNGSSNVVTWTPRRPGRYRIRVRVNATGGSSHTRQVDFTAATTSDGDSRLGINFFVDCSTGEPGRQRILTVSLTGNTHRRNIRFLFKHHDDSHWTVIHTKIANNRALWTPRRSGRYTLRADVTGTGIACHSRNIRFRARL